MHLDFSYIRDVQLAPMVINDPASNDARLTFAKAFREARLQAGMTQAEVAAKSGVAVNHVSAIERGVKPNVTEQTMRDLAASVGMLLEVRLRKPSRQQKT